MEARRYQRVSLQIWAQISITDPTKQEQLPLSNLSCGGAFIVCENPYEPNTVVEIKFELPQEYGSIHATGFVCWKGKNQCTGEFGMGIQFLMLSEENQKRLQMFIACFSGKN